MKHIRLITAIAIITVLFGSVYGMVQQQNRLQANDMPLLLATETARLLDSGAGLAAINMSKTDIQKSLVPFTIIYNKKGKAVSGSGYLGDKLAELPAGVAAHAKTGKPHSVTWEPRKNVRIASVIVVSRDYYVLGGQSLAPVEDRATVIGQYAVVGYGVCIGIVGVSVFLLRRQRQICLYCTKSCNCCANDVATPNSSLGGKPTKKVASKSSKK